MTLILYFGHYGSTKKAAELLASYLQDAVLVDGMKEKVDNISNYERIILGTNIRVGKPNKVFRKWCKKNFSELKDKKVSAFVIAADGTKQGAYRNQIASLLPNVHLISYFGGELNPEPAKGICRKIIQNCIEELKKEDLELPSLHRNQIIDFANQIN